MSLSSILKPAAVGSHISCIVKHHPRHHSGRTHRLDSWTNSATCIRWHTHIRHSSTLLKFVLLLRHLIRFVWSSIPSLLLLALLSLRPLLGSDITEMDCTCSTNVRINNLVSTFRGYLYHSHLAIADYGLADYKWHVETMFNMIRNFIITDPKHTFTQVYRTILISTVRMN